MSRDFNRRTGVVPLIVAAAVVMGPSLPPAAMGQESVLDRLPGQWVGRGELFGQPATFQMDWENTLGGRFLRLRFRNAVLEGDSARPLLEAEALYRVDGADTITGTWFDSRGETLELRASVEDSALTTAWVGAGERGRTVYRIGTDGRLHVEDAVYRPSGLSPFGTASYCRRERPDCP